MSEHLTEEQISAVIAGERSPQAAGHLAGCEFCRRQAESFEDVLGHFRSALREWSGIRMSGPIYVQPRKHLWPVLVCACSVAVVILLGMGYRFPTRQKPSPALSSSTVDSDALLLNHVRADISRSTPPGMEALVGIGRPETTRH
jgi:hypothetical protein